IFPSIDPKRRVTVGNWTPRGIVSGPWQRGKAWFSSTTELQYSNTLIPELPPGQDRTHAYRANTLLHNQINLSNANILYVGLLFNFQYAPRSGLSFLDPRETTVDRRSRQWFGYVKDQHAFSRGALVELGYAASRTFSRETPQGSSPYVITPFGRSGNSYANSRREAARDQLILNGFLPSFHFLGEHRFKTGADAV